MRGSSQHKDITKLIPELQRQGFRIRIGKHYVVYPPDRTKRVFTMPISPSDQRGWLNLKRDLRHAGFKEE